ncbi:integrase-like protein [Paraburkholderia sp. BL6665CI2N2]|nr:integrase-like protein [Paraburkholderia sp. BL6665CI2N2]
MAATRRNSPREVQIAAAHERTRQTYGRERLQADLRDHGVRVCLHRIRRIRSKLGLRCKQKRKFRNTTDSKHDLPVAPNLLERNFDMSAPNQAWVSDITYVWTDEGSLYLAGIKDLFNGELVGYAMRDRMTRNLVMQALFGAVALKRPPAGLTLHSDSKNTGTRCFRAVTVSKEGASGRGLVP